MAERLAAIFVGVCFAAMLAAMTVLIVALVHREITTGACF